MRLIDADKLLSNLKSWKQLMDSSDCIRESQVIKSIIDMIANEDELIDASPVVHGRWIFHDDEWGRVAECSVCHTKGMLYGKYCVECGAKMDLEE